LIKLLEH